MSSLRTVSVATGTGYAVAMAAVAVLAAWPIYDDAQLLVVAAVAVIAAIAISAAATLWRWQGWLTVAAAAVAVLAVGTAVAAPPAGTARIPDALWAVASGAITGWKDLVTVDLPVGTYRNLLVPALIVLLVGTLAVLRLSWRADRIGAFAALPAVGMSMFGLLFGLSHTSGAVTVGAVVIAAPRELACGTAALVLSLVWLGLRGASRRRQALRSVAVRGAQAGAGQTDGARADAAQAGAVRVGGRSAAQAARRAGLAAGMVAVAVAAAVVVTPAVASGTSRDVLRGGVGPEQAISRAVSPLTDYRANFADDVVNQPLFTVSAVGGPLPERVRLATLTQYDGAEYRVSADDADARFLRVPARLPGAAGTERTVSVSIERLRGIWLPTVGSVQRVDYEGADAAAHAAAFYYDAGTEAAVQTDGIADGQTYRVTATVPDTLPAVDGLQSPGASPAVTIPDSVKTWMGRQDAGTGGAALVSLVQKLRERGYLSHALDVPAGGAAWMRALGDDYVFAPSASGHSLARVDAVFRALLTRQDTAQPGQSLVAATGDDEQFAVAVSLMAQQLGFPARVVLGARLTQGASDTDTPVCTGGVCTGDDIIAWTEVQAASGQWVPVEVTPQHSEGAQDAVIRQRDPQIPTDVRPQNAQEVNPPDPVRHESGDTGTHTDDTAALASIWGVLRTVGMGVAGLLIVLGPFAAILVAKGIRRRGRHRSSTPAAQVVGGWEEYVDAAVDHGLPAPHVQTRRELAAQYELAAQGELATQDELTARDAAPAATALAVEADRAVFSGTPLSAGEAERFWGIVDGERRRLAASVSWWRRMLAALSLKSFARGISSRPARGRRTSRTADTERSGRDTSHA